MTRELNRSFYCAEAYEYPIALFTRRDGRGCLAHCPDGYNRLDIEDLGTGERLTQRETESPDVFHSRLSASPDSRYLLSAGWVWHPYGVAMLFDLDAAFERPETLDQRSPVSGFPVDGEVEAACWLTNNTIAVSLSLEEPLGKSSTELQPGEVGVWSISDGRWLTRFRPAKRLGTMHELDGNILGLYDHPQLIDPQTGGTVAEWPELRTGLQTGSYGVEETTPPPVAVDSNHRRFAVAEGSDIVVVEIS